MTAWDERALERANLFYPPPEGEHVGRKYSLDDLRFGKRDAFIAGAAWQREQLLTDETHPRTITKDEFEALCLTVADQIPPGACRAEVLAYTATYALRAAGIEVIGNE